MFQHTRDGGVIGELIVAAALAVGAADDGHVLEPASMKCKQECKLRRHMRRTVRPYRAKLRRMAWCESTGRWHIATGNGYYGGLQFDVQTWRSVGGTGMPHWASRLEQSYRAVLLIRRRGYQPWPICGYA